MLVILIAGALVVVVAGLGLSMLRVAALSDRNSAAALTEWIAKTRLAERQVPPPDEAFRAAG
jgi:hypothetical protein